MPTLLCNLVKILIKNFHNNENSMRNIRVAVAAVSVVLKLKFHVQNNDVVKNFNYLSF